MKRFFFLSFVMLSSILSVGLFTSSSVNAASAYDNINSFIDFKSDNDELFTNSLNYPFDISTYTLNDLKYFFNDLSPNYIGNHNAIGNISQCLGVGFTSQDISNALNYGNFLGGTNEVAFVNPHIYAQSYFLFENPENITLHFDTAQNYKGMFVESNTNIYRLTIRSANLNNGTIEYICQPIETSSNGYINFVAGNSTIENDFYFLNFMNNNVQIVYPPDFDGEIIEPPVTPPEIIDSSRVPNLTVFDNSSYKIQISDSNFFIIDEPAFTCDDGFIPIINFEIWDRGDVNTQNDEILLTTGFHSASSFITYEFPVVQSEKYYRVIAWYSGCDELNFTESSFLDFTMTRYGTIYRPAFQDCIVEDFPWFDLETCMENFATISSMLTFGSIVTPPNFADIGNMQCYQLQSDIALWLQVPSGMVMCPQLPPSVRNTVTPFILFFLGLVTSRFLFTRRDI